MSLPAGKLLGRYEIRALLGKGGMGEVYLAHDTQLRRPVAVKLLPQKFLEDESRLRRFRQEAFAVAALSHPNIAHIYEIGAEAEAKYIVMEFVDGETLTAKIHRAETELSKLLDYLAQVADGLAKAHSVGIIHRDLKPDNIMITRDGHAKILDFGLAKINRPETLPTSVSENMSGLPTVMLPHQSLPGSVMGTVGYMSPEQVRGRNEELDHRSDIFSFGCILYEAATKRLAFQGESQIDTLHKLVYSEPPPISEFDSQAPAELQRIVNRCLAKDPDRRYQTIKDVAIELRELRPERSAAAATGVAVVSEGRTVPSAATEILKARTTAAMTSNRRPAFAFAAVIVLLGLAGAAYYFWHSRIGSFTPPQQRLISTFSGSHRAASFSPDGKSIAFLSDAAGMPQVWIENLSEAAPRQITSGQARAARPRWSPNGNQIAYERRMGETSGIWMVKPGGGEPWKVIDGGRNANWSWDGNRLVFERGYDIWTANADGSDQRRLEGVPSTDLLLADRAPAFSPDGNLIAFFEKDKGPIGDFWVIPSAGGQARRLTFDNTHGGTPVFTHDGKFIVFSSLRAGSWTLWKVSVNGGQPEPVLVSAGEDTEPEISRDGRQLIYTNTRNQFLLTITDPASGEMKTLKESRLDVFDPSFSPNGVGVVFFEMEGDGDIQIIIVNADGTRLTQITHGKDERNIHPQWSADGSAIFFYQIRPNLSFRKIEIGGGQSTELVSGWEWGTNNGARVDPQGRRIIYSKLDKGKPVATMIRDLATGSEIAFTMTLRLSRWSPDGSRVIGVSASTGKDEIVVCPVNGEGCRKLTDGWLPHWDGNSRVYFARDSKLRDAMEIWTISAAGGDEKKVAELRPVHPIGQFFDVSASGKIVWIKYEQGRNELWLATLPAL